MATFDLSRYPSGFPIIDARSTVESEPEHVIQTGDYSLARVYFDYTGTVTACNLLLWFHRNGTWYRASSTDDGAPLTGEDEARDFHVRTDASIGFTVESITGGGTVAVSVEGVD